MSRLLAEPLAAEVELRQEAPALVRLAQGPRRVARVCARWRVESDWWRAPVAREYWKLLLEDRRPAPAGSGSGLLCDVYRDLVDGGWWLSRLYD
jgi:hypothetical protein